MGYKSPIYRTWCGMKSRCQNSNDPRYASYGGRGIRVCRRWQSFAGFEADMLSTYVKDRTLERKNNNGNYTPKNCCWATKKEQARNRRNNRWVVYEGHQMILAEAAEKAGLPLTTVFSRMTKGRSEADWFKPSWGANEEHIREQPHVVLVNYKGEMRTISEAARLAGLSPRIVHVRRSRGWPESDWYLPNKGVGQNRDGNGHA